MRLPTGFLPIEDQGYLLANIQLPNAASLERTQEVLGQIDGILKQTPGIQDWVSLGGFSLIDGTNASNAATVAGFIPLVVAAGAGAFSRQAIGTAVVGGMIAATIMSYIFTPVFYVVFQRLSELGQKSEPASPQLAAAKAERAV